MLEGSLPESGSVRPKQPMTSPAAMRGSHSCFCSSDPNFQIGNMASEPCTDTKLRAPGVAGLELEAGQAVGHGAGAGAAVALEVHAQQPEGAHLLGQLDREGAVLEPLGHVGEDAVAHELANGVAQQALLLAEQGVDARGSRGRRRCRIGRCWAAALIATPLVGFASLPSVTRLDDLLELVVGAFGHRVAVLVADLGPVVAHVLDR